MTTTDDRDDPELKEIDDKGMQKTYLVLSPEEIEKGYVRPLRYAYQHEKCGTITSMGVTIAQTYARDPHFYGGTYCAGCHTHYQVGFHGEFVWVENSIVTDIKVGT